MSDQSFERAVGTWLESGSDRTPPAAIDAVLLAVKTTPQERDLRIPRRFTPMPTYLRLAAVIAIVAVVGAGALMFSNRSPDVGGQPTPTPTPAATPTASPNVSPTASPLDTSGWVPYTSERYGFTISHPPGWDELPASRAWSYEADTNDWLSPGMEAFFTPAGIGVRVSAWAVPLEPGFTNDPTWADVEAWVEEFCEKTDKAPCSTAVQDRAVQLCLEARDCHPGLLVPFESEVKAFYADCCADQMVVVVVWWGESEPAVAPFGGSRRLLEAFLSTMDVWPADGDRGRP